MLNREDKAGLYITIIFHLVVVIILLIAQIGFSLQRENSFVIDFSKQEELRRIEEKKSFDEDIDKRIEEMIAGSSGIEFRNVTASRNKATLKDDRNTDADQLYKDAEKLAKDLKNGQTAEKDEDYVEEPAKIKKENKAQDKTYSGPSVLSWHLEGRKASHLPIPAYKCMGGGMVTVLITVDNSGRVVDVRIQEETSSDDRCLREFARRAARMSRFSAKQDAPARQTGDIVYQFIAQ
ncbi:MAG: energy transducer TonB [Candidatus Cryptobacteroides sp.]|nr:energy transducer TonB [Bacteroidales bacterium]